MDFWFLLAGWFIYITYMFSYSYTFLVNPGYPKKSKETLEGGEGLRYCKMCNIWVNPKKNVKHCRDCDICVEGYDHHCPWTGKCIGKGNKFPFFAFLAFVMFFFVYFALSLALSIEKMTK